MLMTEAREQITDYGKRMSSAGLCKGTAGNLSVYDPETGYMAISPSGIGYFDTFPEDIVIMDLDGRIIEGTRKPSSEYNMHAAFYLKKPGIRGIVHTHSVYCTTFACLGQPIRMIHYCIAGAGTAEIPCAPYTTFGTPELGQYAVETCGDGLAVLLGNHGMIACGSSLEAAFSLAENIEYAAEIQWRAMAVGEPRYLSDQQIADALERFKSYGQASDKSSSKAGY